MNIKQTLKISRLFCVYKNLLTTKQQQILKAYVDYNTSFGEIAEQFGSSRQAVFDLLKRTIKKLEEYEQKLKIVKKLDTFYSKILKMTEGSLTKQDGQIIIETIKELEE